MSEPLVALVPRPVCGCCLVCRAVGCGLTVPCASTPCFVYREQEPPCVPALWTYALQKFKCANWIGIRRCSVDWHWSRPPPDRFITRSPRCSRNFVMVLSLPVNVCFNDGCRVSSVVSQCTLLSIPSYSDWDSQIGWASLRY